MSDLTISLYDSFDLLIRINKGAKMGFTSGKKMFAYEVPYNEIDTSNFNDLLEKYKKRIECWYIKPGEDLRNVEYSGFIVMGISCIIIDTLSGYRYGIDENHYNGRIPGDTTKTDFIKFCKEYFQELNKNLPSNCISKYSELNNKTYADVLYESYRCKILHESRIPYYGGISEDVKLIDYHDESSWILINPHALLKKTREVLDVFIIQLKDGEYCDEFKRRFRFIFKNEIDSSVWVLI